jgi:hypothetical protein
MIRRIVLTNYMSHAETVIEPADGLTVLAGPNNCGKSAVITALQTLCYNERGNYMMRHGTAACRVAVETDDGHVIEWERSKKKSVRYIINGREVDRLRGSVPDDLHEKLRLPHVESVDGSDDFDIHFGEQKKPIFLLDQNGRQAATFFASSSDAALLVEMQAEHKRNVTEHRGDERSLVKEVARCERQLEPLTTVPNIDSALETLESEYDQLSQASEELGKLEQCTQAVADQISERTEFLTTMQALAFLQTPPVLLDTKSLEEIVSRFDTASSIQTQENGRQRVMSNLVDPPQLEKTADLIELLEEFAEEANSVTQLSDRQLTLQPLVTPPALVDEDRLADLIGHLEDGKQDQHGLQQKLDNLQKIVEPPPIADVEELAETVLEMARAVETLKQFQRFETELAQLIEPPVAQETDDLTELIDEYNAAMAEKSELSMELQDFDQQRHELIELMITWAKDNPTCPTCGSPTQPDQWIELKEVEADVQS